MVKIEHYFYDKKHVLDYNKLPDNSVYPHLVHEDGVQFIADPENIPPYTLEVDALITDKSDVILSIGTADCAPIVLKDEKDGVIGLIHAGWKSVQKGIIPKTIKDMERLGAKAKHIKAFIGPCLQKQSFECGKDMKDMFCDKDSDNEEFFELERGGIWFFDLVAFCTKELNESGIASVDASNIDTLTNDNWHSYRGFEAQVPGVGYENGKYRNLTTVEIKK